MFRTKKIALLLCILILLVLACTTPYHKSTRAKGVYHRVKGGETLFNIAHTYNVDIQELAEINNITDPTLINVGSVVFVPNAHEVREIKPVVSIKKLPDRKPGGTPAKKPAKKPSQTVEKKKPATEESIRFERERFTWPVRGVVSSPFGIQPNGMSFNGIKIDAKEGTPVVAAAQGRVIHSAHLKYYGETIIIKHPNSFTSVYAFLKDRKVTVGNTVSKGQQIALLGRYKKNGKSCLHFEIRKKNKPKNPLFYLPKR